METFIVLFVIVVTIIAVALLASTTVDSPKYKYEILYRANSPYQYHAIVWRRQEIVASTIVNSEQDAIVFLQNHIDFLGGKEKDIERRLGT